MTTPASFLPDTTPNPHENGHRPLESLGFTPDSSMEFYSHSQTPCPHCPDANTHRLFAVHEGGFSAPRFWCQKWGVVEYGAGSPAAAASGPDVGNIAELKALIRWMIVKGKKPHRGFTFSHRDPSPCRKTCGQINQQTGERPEVSPESFVRSGGVCYGHILPGGKVLETYAVEGWFTYSELQARGGDSSTISYCTKGSDAPAVVIVDIDIKDGCRLAGLTAKAALVEWLRGRGASVVASSNHQDARTGFRIADRGYYHNRKQEWKLGEELGVELFTPGAPNHVRIYDLDGDLPLIDPAELDAWLADAGLSQTQGAQKAVRVAGTGGWQRRHAEDGGIVILDSPQNMRIALRGAGLGNSGTWRYNEWDRRPEILVNEKFREVTDDDILKIRERVGDLYGDAPTNFIPKGKLVREVTRLMALENLVNPQTEAFRGVVWDGDDRWTMLGRLFGQTLELDVEKVKLLVRGVVVRAHCPGAVFPYIVNIYSAKHGVGKGDSLKAIANGRHSLLEEHMFTGYDVEKKLREKARRMSILEVGEREGLTARGQGTLKSLVTTEDTTLRDAFDRLDSTTRFPNILVATTNNIEVLTEANSRRDPVIRIPDGHRIDLGVLKALLPQLWAQACAEYDAGWFDDSTVTYGKAVRLPRALWEPMLEDSNLHRVNTPIYETLNKALNENRPASVNWRVTALSVQIVLKDHGIRYSNAEFSRTMKDLDWEHAPRMKAWGRGHVWQRIGAPPPPYGEETSMGENNAWGHRPVVAMFPANTLM